MAWGCSGRFRPLAPGTRHPSPRRYPAPRTLLTDHGPASRRRVRRVVPNVSFRDRRREPAIGAADIGPTDIDPAEKSFHDTRRTRRLVALRCKSRPCVASSWRRVVESAPVRGRPPRSCRNAATAKRPHAATSRPTVDPAVAPLRKLRQFWMGGRGPAAGRSVAGVAQSVAPRMAPTSLWSRA